MEEQQANSRQAERENSDGNVFCVQDQRELLGALARGKLKSKSQAFLIQLLLETASLALHDLALLLHSLAYASSVLMGIMLAGCYIYSVRIDALCANARGNTSDGCNSTGTRWLHSLAHVHPAW